MHAAGQKRRWQHGTDGKLFIKIKTILRGNI
nr:MAG TPA: hypothetical protein [Caudoviricetes sp.]